jgi:hypothetical protein
MGNLLGRGQFNERIIVVTGGELGYELGVLRGWFEELGSRGQAEFLVLHPHEPCRSAEHLQEELKRIEAGW